MRKNIYFLAVLFIAIIITSCTSEKTALQEATGASNSQTKYIENRLADDNITYMTVAISSNPFLDGMDTNWQAYDLIDHNATYVLLLRKSDNDFTAVLDSDGRNIDGLIDSGVTPALFENGENKFQQDNKYAR